jgi:hypothetical protein
MRQRQTPIGNLRTETLGGNKQSFAAGPPEFKPRQPHITRYRPVSPPHGDSSHDRMMLSNAPPGRLMLLCEKCAHLLSVI